MVICEAGFGCVDMYTHCSENAMFYVTSHILLLVKLKYKIYDNF